MSRSRIVLFVSMTVVLLGVLVGVGALWMDQARAAVGPLPGEGLILPADSRFVMGVDVRRLVSSPFWERYGKRDKMRPQAWTELEEKTGLDLSRDVDQVVLAGSGAPQTRETPLVLAVGRFDPVKIGKTIEESGKATARKVQGLTLYEYEGPVGKEQRTLAVTLLDNHTVLVGPPHRVEATLASRARGESPLRENAALLRLVENVRPGSTFWMVGDQTLLSNMPKAIPAPGGGGDAAASLNLPPLQALTVTGDLEPDVSLALVGEASDNTSATKLADVMRGLVALVTMQAHQKPELQQLASAVSIATEENRVLVNARLPYELIDSLQPKAKVTPDKAAPAEAEPAPTE